MANPLAVLPIHVTLQIIALGNSTNVVVTYADTPSPNQAPVLPDGYTAFPDIGVAYKYFSFDLTWDLARKHCITEGGNLAVIDSLKKLDYALNVTSGKKGTGPFIGIHRLFNTAEWVSAETGLPLAYVPWRTDEDPPTSTDRCAALWVVKGVGIGSWDCSKRLSFTCEVPISKQPLQMAIDTKLMVTDKPHVNRTLKARTTIPDGFIPFPDVGVAYRYIWAQADWNSARKICIAHNSTLAVIDSAEKKDHAERLINRRSGAWIGIHRLFGASEWVSIKTAVDNPLLPDGFIPFPDIGAAYKYFDSLRTWNSAQETCLEYNSTLAVIDSWKKIDHVQSMRTNNVHDVLTGIHKLSDHGEWLSVKTGLPVAVLPWAPPRYDSFDTDGCLAVRKDGSGLVARPIMNLRNFVCEIPLPTTLQRCNELNSTAIFSN